MCAALGMRPTCGAALTTAGTHTTVATEKMLVSSAQVGSNRPVSLSEIVLDGRKHTTHDKAHIQSSLRYSVPPKLSCRHPVTAYNGKESVGSAFLPYLANREGQYHWATTWHTGGKDHPLSSEQKKLGLFLLGKIICSAHTTCPRA